MRVVVAASDAVAATRRRRHRTLRCEATEARHRSEAPVSPPRCPSRILERPAVQRQVRPSVDRLMFAQPMSNDWSDDLEAEPRASLTGCERAVARGVFSALSRGVEASISIAIAHGKVVIEVIAVVKVSQSPSDDKMRS